MLDLWRKHLSSCKHELRRYKSCSCFIGVQGTLRGKWMKKSLGIRNWDAAQRLIRDWESGKASSSLSFSEPFERFIADCDARHLRNETLSGTP
jgi:hypothetical protein